ncbi:MAG: protein kinase, partial [Planctomycetales bacterium]|nr:protein kinase [Planctomycetales bacterium]
MRDLEVFAQAIEIPDLDKRKKFVDAACGDDFALRRELERLLASYTHTQTESLLEDSPVDGQLVKLLDKELELNCQTNDEVRHEPTKPWMAPTDETIELDVEQSIGVYRLRERIGVGGFGYVFVAEQESPVRRKVALKIIKPGMDSKEVLARFAAERQALALMDHPNIAKVFDGGSTPRGLPYFVMELVRGVSITEYCDQTKLDIGGRLRLFIDTCRAIQHAHHKGIIHRDVKPSNVMVTLHDSQPVVKIIDFGVAKALNQRLVDVSIYTKFAFMIGTPTYMSPEQAEISGLDVDTRSDIYSLGVLLYELLAGSPPFHSERFARASIDVMRKIIREEEPQRPSQRIVSLGPQSSSVASMRRLTEPQRLGSLLRGDLDWIVMKALSKERSQRYESANAFASDVQRYLKGETVEARPPSWSYVTSRFVGRHRGLVAALSTIACVITLGVVASLVFAFWALHERSKARRSQVVAVINSDLANAKSQEAVDSALRATEAEQRAVSSLIEARIAFAGLKVWSGEIGQQHEALHALDEAIHLARETRQLDQHLLELRTHAVTAMTRVDLRSVRFLPQSGSYSIFTSNLSADFSTLAIPHRDDDQGPFVSICSNDEQHEEQLRVPIPWDTRTNFHDTVETQLSPNGQYLLITTGDFTEATLWNLSIHQKVMDLRGRHLNWAEFSHDSKVLYCVQFADSIGRNRVHQIALPNGESLGFFTCAANGAMRLAPSGKLMAIPFGSYISIVDVQSRLIVARFASGNATYDALDWSASSRLLASVNRSEIRVWNVDSAIDDYAKYRDEAVQIRDSAGTEKAPVLNEFKPFQVLVGHESTVDWLRFHPQHEHLLVSSSWDRTTRFWNVFSGGLELSYPGVRPRISPDGKQIAIVDAQGLNVFDFAAGEACRWLTASGHWQAVFDPLSHFIVLGARSGGMQCYTLPDALPIDLPQKTSFRAIDWDHKRNSLLLGGSLGLFELPCTWTAGNVCRFGPARQLLACPGNAYNFAQSSHCGRWTVLSEHEAWGSILLDRSTGRAEHLYQFNRQYTSAISAHGEWLARGYADRVEVTSLPQREVIAEIPMRSVAGLAFSRDNRLLIANDSSECKLISTANWQPQASSSPCELCVTPAISPDSQTAIIPLPSSELAIINVDGKSLCKLKYANAPRLFTHLSLSEDGNWLAAADESKGATLWNIHAIRARLTALGIDWSESPPVVDPPTQWQVAPEYRVDAGDISDAQDLTHLPAEWSAQQRFDELEKRIQDGLDLPS